MNPLYLYNTTSAREEFALSGEDWLMSKLKEADIDTIFDVGSNQGEWSRLARECFPSACIHTFEIIPEVYCKLINNITTLGPRVIPNGFGLGEKIGTIPMKYCEVNDRWSTHLNMLSPGTVADMSFQWRDCLTSTGDAYMKHHKIDRVDLLKIDVEGAEHLVLKGFIQSMTAGNVGCIQFEYGQANIVSRWLLVDANELLTPLGYVFGKLYPGGVTFKRYDLNDENFIGPNIVAVHRDRQDILTTLST
jgi:FkbM family methyltransferase